jgi:hypothetical protein
MAEQPTITEPKEPEKTTESADADILAKLKELQVNDPQKLENMAMASSQAGKLANDLGQTRAELAQVKEYLAKMQTTQQEPYEYTDGIDVGSVVRKETRSVIQEIMAEQQANQRKAQEAYWTDMSEVQGDRRYDYLKGAFEKHMANYNTQQKINLGKTTASREYQKVKDAYFDILEETQSTFGKIQKPVAPPYVEGSETHVPQMPTMDEDKKQKIKNRTDPSKGWSGTDEDITSLVKDMMAGDSIFK